MKLPLCSILLPSWRRIDACEQCITSIVDSCDDPSRVEICLRLQVDDIASIHHIPKFLKLAPTVRVMIGLPYNGYASNHLHFQDAADIAKGEWVWLMNDDCVVNGKGWDTRLAQKPKDIILVPSIHCLGFSRYENDMDCGAQLVPNKAWEKCGVREFQFPPDEFWRNLFRKHGWRYETLDVGFWHQREDDNTRNAHYASQTYDQGRAIKGDAIVDPQEFLH